MSTLLQVFMKLIYLPLDCVLYTRVMEPPSDCLTVELIHFSRRDWLEFLAILGVERISTSFQNSLSAKILSISSI